MKLQSLSLLLSACVVVAQPQRAPALDLLERYPTSLTAGERAAERAREWAFAETDIFHLSRFQQGGKGFELETGPADLGVGHCADGAVWAVVLPREGGTVSWGATNRESVARVWLRFHPSEINELFPPETVSASTDVSTNLASQIRSIADTMIPTSYRAGMRVLIPEPGECILKVNNLRQTIRVHTGRWSPAGFTPERAAKAFDQLWTAFDNRYAMFGLRPEVDWNKLRDAYRPKALASTSTEEFAGVCAEMLKSLRDLHVWLKIGSTNVPVYTRTRTPNSNPSAHRALLGELNGKFPVQWTVTPDKIGFIETRNWHPGKGITEQCAEALEAMRDTRALIVDVRMNLGGNEDLAGEFAGRFLAKEFAYASHQLRNGAHTDFTEKLWRTVKPRGSWRYDRPVLLLIGERCISSNESFVAMMAGATNVTMMGAHTAGSSGNPKIITLPLDITVGMPVWIAYLPDGTPLDERGIQPQIKFEPQAGAFEGKRDDLLAAALERLRPAPLPAKPIGAN